ncbi:DUF3899 domain-containing protein [Planococcus sp. N028]|uniref:DUF3899 domain-containing protein n=1 Tax=Planococcus shixiaomingii TaxID=3058393 RepID=A0ABT8N0U7_9BACL|nr:MULTISPECIES: DUF3899 domain-containing protein [unclassified Planococcus (in: firmicutes)]MDN7241479.1 DUF3899 domain-containing protein [Planococcus sp. N028]WKA53732.1 DUF3899 domain-containing protein [Planococcus sp. N022]
MKKTLIGIAVVQILIFLTILFRAESLSLLSYINNSFIYGGIIIFFGLWIFVVRTGVFDIFTISMRKVFKGKSTMEDDEMRPPSELFNFSSSPLLIIGSVTILLMGLALLVYEL